MCNKFQRTPYVLAFKTSALLSFFMGVGLLSICSWVVISLSEHDSGLSESNDPTSSKFQFVQAVLTGFQDEPSNVPSDVSNSSSSSSSPKSPSPKESLEKFKTTWKSVSPFFQGSCGVALVLGLLQLISCISVLTSSSKGASKPLRVKLWKVVHLLISLLLICCFLIPITVDYNQKDGGIREHLSKVMNHLDRGMKGGGITLSKDGTTSSVVVLDTENVDNMELLSIALLTDSIGILILVLFTHGALKYLTYDVSGKIPSPAIMKGVN